MVSNSILSVARSLSRHNGQPYHLAAILMRGKSPIRIGINRDKTNPNAFRSFDDGSTSYCLHAEMDALNYYDIKETDVLYIVRWTKNGKTAIAKPCSHCAYRIGLSGIKKVFYTDRSGNFVRL